MTMLLVLAVFCLAGAAYFLGEMATAPARQRWLSVRRAATYGQMEVPLRAHGETFGERFVVPLREWLAGWALKVNPRMSVDGDRAQAARRRARPQALADRLPRPQGRGRARRALPRNGRPHGRRRPRCWPRSSSAESASSRPTTLLTLKARSRRERVQADLPDALDLLAVSVEAGLGFDGAVAKLSEHMEGPLAEEFGLTLSEMRIGESRQEALKRMAERVDAPELSAFVRAIIQADQLGTTLGRILRVQAADSRLRRQAAAEERAMKAPIKMLFPTVLFIFPAMFLVILGPAILNIQELFWQRQERPMSDEPPDKSRSPRSHRSAASAPASAPSYSGAERDAGAGGRSAEPAAGPAPEPLDVERRPLRRRRPAAVNGEAGSRGRAG